MTGDDLDVTFRMVDDDFRPGANHGMHLRWDNITERIVMDCKECPYRRVVYDRWSGGGTPTADQVTAIQAEHRRNPERDR